MLTLTKKVLTAAVVIWQKVLETARGGFTLDVTGLTVGTVITGGSPISFDEQTRKAKVLKCAKMYAGATNVATAYQVEKGHLFVVGEYIANVLLGKAYAITSIDTSNAAYDTINIGTTLAVTLIAGDTLFQSSTTGASNAALFVTPNGALYEDLDVAVGADLSVVLRGTVYNRRVTFAQAAKASCPLIIFSQSN